MMVHNTLPRAVTIHGLDHARAALRPGLPVLLLSARGAASYAGAGWWRALIEAAPDHHGPAHQPDALDCGDQPGRALEAIAAGCQIIVLHPCPAFASVARRAPGVLVLQNRPPSLDLAIHGADRGLLNWLQGDTNAPIG